MQRLACGPASDLGLGDLSGAYVCVQVMETCNEKDVAAMRLLSRVAPSYRRLKLIVDNHAVSEQTEEAPQAEMAAGDRLQVDDVASQLVTGISMHSQDLCI